MIRVMVCDDMVDIRKYYIDSINSENDMEIVCEAGTAEEAVEKALLYKPDIIMMDVQMDDECSGIAATERIMQAFPTTKVIMLTIHNDDNRVLDAYMAGAVDYMIKSMDTEEICNTIRKTYGTEEFVGARIASALKEHIKKAKRQEVSIMYLINNMSKLTATENIILEQLYQKKNRKKIAEDNYMSEETVKIHIRHILRKLNFESTAAMIKGLDKMGIMEFWVKMRK